MFSSSKSDHVTLQLSNSLVRGHAVILKTSPQKLCDYCGKESEVDALRCADCGTAFPSVEIDGTGVPAEPAPPAAKGPTLGAKAATMILLAYLAAQITVGALVGI